jgi:hypothetical protein
MRIMVAKAPQGNWRNFLKGNNFESSITKLHFIRPDVAIVDVSGELSGFQKVYPALPVGKDGVLRNKLCMVPSRKKAFGGSANFTTSLRRLRSQDKAFQIVKGSYVLARICPVQHFLWRRSNEVRFISLEYAEPAA